MSKGPRAENMPWAPHNPNPSLYSIHTVVAKINLISLQFATNVYYFYHTNANFLDPAVIQAPGAYSGKYGMLISNFAYINF